MELHFSIFVPFCLYQLTIAIHEFTPILKRSTVLGDWESVCFRTFRKAWHCRKEQMWNFRSTPTNIAQVLATLPFCGKAGEWRQKNDRSRSVGQNDDASSGEISRPRKWNNFQERKKKSLSKKVELAGAKIEGKVFFERSSWGDLKIPKHKPIWSH